MKIMRPFLATMILLMVFSSISFAFEPSTDCSIKITTDKFQGWKISSVQSIFDDYTNTKYSTYKNDQYILCFDEPLPGFAPKTTLSIDTSKIQKPILIYNFIASSEKLTTPILLQLTGSSITLLNSTLTGPGSGTAIQIASGASATIGPTVSFINFATGVYIAKDGNALVTQGKFTNVTTPIAYEIPAFAGMTEEWIGKHVNETDTTATKVDRIAGKLALTDCGGSVEMYLNVGEELEGWPIQYHATCSVSELKDDTLELTAADGTKKEIAEGACYFDCNGIDVLKDNYVSFAYTSSAGITMPFTPFPAAKVSDLTDVIFTTAIPDYLPPSGATGNENTIYVPPVNPGAVNGADNGSDKVDADKLFISTTDQTSGAKEQELADEQNNDDPDEPINASSASSLCTLITSANSPQAWPLIIWLMGLPAILACRIKKRF